MRVPSGCNRPGAPDKPRRRDGRQKNIRLGVLGGVILVVVVMALLQRTANLEDAWQHYQALAKSAQADYRHARGLKSFQEGPAQ